LRSWGALPALDKGQLGAALTPTLECTLARTPADHTAAAPRLEAKLPAELIEGPKDSFRRLPAQLLASYEERQGGRRESSCGRDQL
jgi:hypothetical protein